MLLYSASQRHAQGGGATKGGYFSKCEHTATDADKH